jgi:hypothetical protein
MLFETFVALMQFNHEAIEHRQDVLESAVPVSQHLRLKSRACTKTYLH